jgi:YVTN family beta-propeller protein
MPRRSDTPRRLLTTVLFTDIVESTRMAAELGDRRWRQLVARHHSLVRQALKKHKGRELDTAGDGFFASFDQPGQAIACAVELVSSLRGLGIEIRAGIHMGEVEVIGPKVGGIAVHVGSRVMSMAGPGEVWVSSTIRDLIAGSDVGFVDRGVHELKGVPAEWHLYSVAEVPIREPAPHEEPGRPVSGSGLLRRRGRQAPSPARGRSAAMLIGVAVLVVISILVGLVLANRRGQTPGASTTSPPVAALSFYLARIDPASRTVERIAVGRHPRGIAIGEGSAWVTDIGGNTVSRIDPASGKVTATIKVGRGPRAIVIQEGVVWVANSLGNSISRIDPATNQVVRTIQVDLEPHTMAVGDGAVWVADWEGGGFLVEKVDSTSGRTVHVTGIVTHAPTEDPPLSLGGGSLWIGGIDGVLSRINPSSGKVSQQIQLGVSISSLDADDDTLWVGANGIPGTVLKLDPRTGEVLAEIPAGGGTSGTGNIPSRPLKLTADRGSVWVTDALNGTVSRIVVVSGQSSLPTNVGQVPVAVAVGLGSVWVTVDRDYFG